MNDSRAADERTVRFQATRSRGEVSAILRLPPDASSLLVLGHGAGAGMSHPFLEALARRLSDGGMATLRYHFPYMERAIQSGKRRPPDYPPILLKTVRSAVGAAAELAPDLPLLAGGKSMGGRMSSQAQAAEPLQRVRGLVFFGFPLHPPGKPGTDRADHLRQIDVPMLFLQGTRDSLAGLELIEPVIEGLPSASLHVVDGADHGFRRLKSSGLSHEEALDELAAATLEWTAATLAE